MAGIHHEKKRHQSISKLSQETADKIAELLPLKLTAHDVDENPQFVKLLTAISRQITPSGVSSTLQKDLTQAEESLKQEKHVWLQYHLLHHELHELLLDYDLQSTSGTQTPAHKQYHKAVEETVSLAEISDYLHCNTDPDSEATLLGLKPTDIERMHPHKKYLSSIQQKLIPDMEDRLRRKCENLASLQQSKTESDKFTFAKASQLPTLVENEKQHLEEEKKSLKKDRSNREKQFWQYYQALTDSLHILEELITKHRLQSQTENDKITTDWLAARCDALCLKLKLVELQVLCMTYTTDSVAALRTISQQLDKATGDAQRELGQIVQTLKTYQAVGATFDSIVQEYAQLQEEVDNKRWAVREFKQSLGQE